MAAGDILIRWVSESSAAVRDMSKVENALKDTMTSGEKWSKRWATASDIALKAGTAMAGAIAVEAVRAGKAAAVQEQAVGGLTAVFKEQSAQMETWAKGMSDMGLSMTDTAQYAARLGSSLKGAGMDLDTAAQQTQKLVELGADLAATYGGTTSDAVQALGAALRGEYDPLEQFGAAITAAQVSAELAANGQDKLTGSALAQAEMAARLKLIWEKTADAQGQAAREADTSAAAYQRFMAKLANVEADLGKTLLPLMEDLAGAMAKISDAAEEDPEAVRTWAKGLIGVAAGLLVLGTAAKAVIVIQGVAAGIKALGKVPPHVWRVTGALGGVVLAFDALQDQFDEFDMSLRGVARGFVDLFTITEEEVNGWAVIGAFDRLMAWMQSFETSGVWKSLRLGLAQVTDAIGLTENRYEQLRLELDEPIRAKLEAANEQALNAAARAENALRRTVDQRYRATIDAAEDKAKAAAREAQRAIDGVHQRNPAKIDGDGTPARTEADRTKAYIDGLGATLNIKARVIGLQAAIGAATAGAPAGYAARAQAPDTLRIDKVEIVMAQAPRDPVAFAREVRDVLVSDEVRTGRQKVAR